MVSIGKDKTLDIRQYKEIFGIQGKKEGKGEQETVRKSEVKEERRRERQRNRVEREGGRWREEEEIKEE